MQSPDPEPRWQARLIWAISVFASAMAFRFWGSRAFFVVISAGIVTGVAVDNWLDPKPESAGTLASKVTVLFAAMAAAIGGTVLLVERIQPFWLGLTLSAAYLLGWNYLASLYARWEA